MAADLHTHTYASDGENSVEDRARQAKEENIDTIAITDHDTINEKLEPHSQEINGTEIITGAEIKCEVNGTSIEILGYFLDPEDESLTSLFDEMEVNREKRMETMIENVNKGENLNLSLKDVEKHAEGTLGRPHLGMALDEKEIVDTVNEAFDKYIGENADTDYYVETKKLDAEEVIQAIHESGGVCSLAHPGRDLPYEEAEEIIEELSDYGLDGIEVQYTYQHKIEEDYDISFAEYLKQEKNIKQPEEIANKIETEIENIAEKYKLIKTGGSDCHGKDSGKHNIGQIKIQNSNVDQLRAKQKNTSTNTENKQPS